MKLFTNKKLIQKITIVMVFLILFNFIVPNYSRAAVTIEDIGEALVTGINWLILKLGDGVIFVLQKIFIGTDAFDSKSVSILPTIALSPGKIFSGVIYALDINFLSPAKGISDINGIEVSDESKDEDFTAIFDKIMIELENKASNENVYAIILSGIHNLMDEEIGNRSSLNFLEYCWAEWGLTTDSNLNTDEISTMIYMRSDHFDSVTSNDEHIKLKNDVQTTLENIGLVQLLVSFGTNKDQNESIFTEASKASNSPANVLHNVIATWYKIMRNISLVFMLSVLVYVGIRIMLSSTAADNTKYKRMLVDWVVAVCILFILHYIMSFTVNITQLITEAFSGEVQATTQDEIMNTVRLTAEQNIASDWNIAYSLIYIALIFYTVYFIFYYVKRVVYIAFLTMIAPLVALTYPIDKMGDSKAQAFEMWLREYIMTVIVQPVHLLIYTAMVTSSLSLALINPIYAIVVIGAMIPAEKFIKEMFGLSSNKGPKGGLLAGATAMGIMQKVASRKPPKFGHHPGENGKIETDKTQEKVQKPRMDGEKQAEFSRAVTGSNTSVTNASSSTKSKSIRTEDLPDINNGDYSSNRDTVNEKGDLPKTEDIRLSDLDATSDQNKEWYLGDDRQKNIKRDDGLPKSEDIKLDNLDVAADENREWDLGDEEQTGIAKNDFSEISQNEKSLNTNRNIPLTQNSDNPEMDKEPKKKSIRGAAVGATVKHYARKIVNGKNLKKLGRGLVKTGLGAVTAGTGAAIGLAAGIVTGDPSKAWQYAAAGAVAGSKIGANVGDGISNLAGGVINLGRDVSNTYTEQKNEILKYDKKAQKAETHKKNKKYATSAETKAEIKKRYPKLSKEEMEKRQNAIVRYRDAGVDDLDIIFNSYNLERGIDSDGKKIGTELSPEHAMYIAQMASRMDDSASSRKSIENSMQTQFAQNYEKDGMDSEMAMTQAKALRKREMQYVDMAKGKTVKEAVSIADQAEINKKAEDRKEEKAAQMQARLNAEAQNNAIIKSKQIRTKNGRINIKNSVITNGNNGNVTINGNEMNIE